MKVETQDNVKFRPVREARDISWRDRLGISLSILCLVHCLLTPFMVALLPVGVSLGFWQHGFHHVFLIVVPLVALIAFVPGWRRHGDRRVWYWGVTGVLFLAAGVGVAEFFGHEVLGDSLSLGIETVFTIIGGACLIRAHLLNRQLCACCDEGHDHRHGHDHDHGSACAHDHNNDPGHDHQHNRRHDLVSGRGHQRTR